jgi:hypothetical protein
LLLPPPLLLRPVPVWLLPLMFGSFDDDAPLLLELLALLSVLLLEFVSAAEPDLLELLSVLLDELVLLVLLSLVELLEPDVLESVFDELLELPEFVPLVVLSVLVLVEDPLVDAPLLLLALLLRIPELLVVSVGLPALPGPPVFDPGPVASGAEPFPPEVTSALVLVPVAVPELVVPVPVVPVPVVPDVEFAPADVFALPVVFVEPCTGVDVLLVVPLALVELLLVLTVPLEVVPSVLRSVNDPSGLRVMREPSARVTLAVPLLFRACWRS